MKLYVSLVTLCSLLILMPSCRTKQGCYSSCPTTTCSEAQPSTATPYVQPAEIVVTASVTAPVAPMTELEEEEDFEEPEEVKTESAAPAKATAPADKEELDEEELDEAME
jgi:hypothetical protein